MKYPNYRKIDVNQTRRVASSMNKITRANARPVGGSGSDWRAKGDVISDKFLIECKDKANPSKQRTIYKEWLTKIELEAIQENKTPALIMGFGDGEDYVILRAIDFYDMVGESDG